MDFLTSAMRLEPLYAPLYDSLRLEKKPVLAGGICDPAKGVLCTTLISDLKEKTLIITPNESTAKQIHSVLSGFFTRCFFFPARDFSLTGYDASSREFNYQRLSVLSKMILSDYDVIVTTIEAACQRTIPENVLKKSLRTVKISDRIDQREFLALISQLGYTASEKVEGAGQFAQRGGIIDIFVPSYEFPVRIELFGDEIDSISFFDVLSQRRTQRTDEFLLLPANEIFFGIEEKKIIKENLNHALEACRDKEKRKFIENELFRLNENMEIASDLFLDPVYPDQSLLDYAADSFFIIFEQTQLKASLEASKNHLLEMLKGLFEQNKTLLPPEKISLLSDFDLFCDVVRGNRALIVENFSSGRSAISPSGIFNFVTRRTTGFSQNMSLLEGDVKDYISRGYKTVLLCENSLAAKTVYEHFTDDGITCAIAGGRDDIEKLPGDAAYIISAAGQEKALRVSEGFELAGAKFAVLCDGTASIKPALLKHKPKKLSPKEKIISYSDLKEGDYVVHENHGIGIYRGIEKIKRDDGTVKDFIKIQYAGSDVLYVPCSNLDSLGKYIGPKSENASLKLNRLGGTDWQKTKSKAKKAASDIAKKLIALYSERLKIRGHAFSPDTAWQKEFEDSFEYEETQSQLNAAAEIKADMEKPYPMDRLLCGDVGFGKTEVALRGIFKCVMDSKQAAVLVPTTILAWQHYQTILTRFRGYPVKIEMLSRFKTKKEQAEIIKKLSEGKVDIIVGTHRLLQNDVKFSALGFLVVDEEQRFGVGHKEKLKEIAKGVDVLTLTATPIPRTLNMALSGIRDMSILEESPGDRSPVQTYVIEHDNYLIIEAIKKELRRKGQVFYLHNNIEELSARAAFIKMNFPEAVVEIAHGKLDKEELSQIWKAMMDKEIDILVCTTIIETGIDLPDANTLIIENADHFGLSQLHQIRGRVGRSDRRAYAYLTYRKGAVLSEISSKRLEAIREYTEFGSGFKIAMRDLEIRGAGNILGAQQHGHLDNVGYDMYMRLLNEAVLEEKGEKPVEKTECFIDLSIDAYIPETYIRSSKSRIDIYQKIALMKTDEDFYDLTDELIDRFGDIPKPVINLFKITKIKNLAEKLGVYKIIQKNGEVTFYINSPNINALVLTGAIYASRFIYSLSGKPRFELRLNPGPCTEQVEEILTHMSGFSKENPVSENKND